MTYRGMNPRTRVLRWAAIAILIGLALGVTLPLAVSAFVALVSVAPDRLAWVGTRLFAFLSYFALAGSVIYGLLLSTRILDRIAHRPVTYALHQDMALIGLGLAVVHVVLLGFDSTVPFSIADMVVPFVAPYRPLWVGVGQVALYITAVVTASFYARRRIGQRAWRLIHYLTFLAFLGTTMHGILSGTDTPTTWAWWCYTVPTVMVVFLTTYRIIDAASTRDERRAAAEAALASARAAFAAGPGAGPALPSSVEVAGRPAGAAGLRPPPLPPSPLDLRAPQPRRKPRPEGRVPGR